VGRLLGEEIAPGNVEWEVHCFNSWSIRSM
jgi:hypothetical protein